MTYRIAKTLHTLGAFAALHVVSGCMQGDVEEDTLDPAAQMAMADGGHTAMPMHDAGMPGHDDPGHTHADGGSHEHGDAICPPDFPRIAPGVTKADDLTVKVVSLTPRPPRQRVPNDWELEITDQTGAPVVGASLVNADSWMEVHLHSGKRPPVVQPLEAPGHYKLDNIDFSMRGPWEVLFDVQAAGETSLKRVSIKICVE